MLTATITPKYINPPRGSARSGSVKDADGVYWGVPTDMLNQFSAGKVVTVEYETSEYNGKQYKNVKRISAATPAQQQQATAKADSTSERIFVCGIVNAAVASGKLALDPNAITDAVHAAREAWSMTFGSPEHPDIPL